MLSQKMSTTTSILALIAVAAIVVGIYMFQTSKPEVEPAATIEVPVDQSMATVPVVETATLPATE